MKPIIELHIDEVVLHGFPSMDRPGLDRIREVLQQQLTGLLAAKRLPQSLMRGGTISRLDGGMFQTGPNNPPEDMGAAVARRVFGGLSGSTISRGVDPHSAGKGGNLS